MFLKFEVGFFKLFDMQTINGICKIMVVKEFNAKEVLFSIGEPTEHLYIVISGQIGVYADNEMTECVTKLGPASVVGERSFHSRNKFRTKVCVAEVATKCFVISKEDYICKIQFFELMQK